MHSGTKILIVTAGALCRNPRPLKEAWTLGEAGYDVTVATVASVPEFERSDLALLKEAPFRKVSVDLLAQGFKPRTRSLARRASTWAARRAVRVGWNSPQAFGPYRALFDLATRFPSNLTIGHTELGLCVVHALARSGRKVAADFEDWHSHDLLPEAQPSRPLDLLKRVESELLFHSAYTSTTSDAMANALHAAYGGPRPVVITNSFPLTPVASERGRIDPPRLVWFSQTIGPGRGLTAFLKAWSLCRAPSRISLIGNVSPNFRARLLNVVPAARRAEIEFVPAVAPQDLPALLSSREVGLALERPTPASRDLTITNKILQYLNAGVAVAASRTQGQIEVMSRAPDAGILVDLDDSAGFASQLDTLLSDRGGLAAMGAAARRAAESTYCWEREAPRLLEAADRALRS